MVSTISYLPGSWCLMGSHGVPLSCSATPSVTWGVHKVHYVKTAGNVRDGDQLISTETGLPSGGTGTRGRKRPTQLPCFWVKRNIQAVRNSFVEKALDPGEKPVEQGLGGWKYEDEQ